MCSHTWPFVTPMDYSSPGFSVHGIFQARILKWVAISYSRGSLRPRHQTHIFTTAHHYACRSAENTQETTSTQLIIVLFKLLRKPPCTRHNAKYYKYKEKNLTELLDVQGIQSGTSALGKGLIRACFFFFFLNKGFWKWKWGHSVMSNSLRPHGL